MTQEENGKQLASVPQVVCKTETKEDFPSLDH